MEIQQAIESLERESGYKIKQPLQYSFGEKAECKELLKKIFIQTDKTIKKFQWLKEYDEVVEWMSDNQGKGLALHGACGRGKSIILKQVLPVLIRMQGKIFTPIKAEDLALLPRTSRDGLTLSGYCKKTKFIGIDEFGRERMGNDFGVKFEALDYVIDYCESNLSQPLFLTSNMDREQITKRYGDHIFDRIQRLCKIVVFNGESLRQ